MDAIFVRQGAPVTNLSREDHPTVPLGQQQLVMAEFDFNRNVPIYRFVFNDERYSVPEEYVRVVAEIVDDPGVEPPIKLLNIWRGDSAYEHHPEGARARLLFGADVMSIARYWVEGRMGAYTEDLFALCFRGHRNRVVKVQMDRRDWLLVFSLLFDQMILKDEYTEERKRNG